MGARRKSRTRNTNEASGANARRKARRKAIGLTAQVTAIVITMRATTTKSTTTVTTTVLIVIAAMKNLVRKGAAGATKTNLRSQPVKSSVEFAEKPTTRRKIVILRKNQMSGSGKR